jgi:hypothetical protein
MLPIGSVGRVTVDIVQHMPMGAPAVDRATDVVEAQHYVSTCERLD